MYCNETSFSKSRTKNTPTILFIAKKKQVAKRAVLVANKWINEATKQGI